MEALKKKIIDEGIGIGTEIVKVDSFLNHQMDVAFLEQLGQAFAERFAGEKIDKILTVEASGIAIACMAAKSFNYPKVVFAKKMAPNTMTEGFYQSEVKSFTKGTVSIIRVAKNYISKGEKILIIDDFLAHGEAAMGMVDIIEQGGAQVVGLGAVIEKEFQGGGKRLADGGIRVESLAVITSIMDGNIQFK